MLGCGRRDGEQMGWLGHTWEDGFALDLGLQAVHWRTARPVVVSTARPFLANNFERRGLAVNMSPIMVVALAQVSAYLDDRRSAVPVVIDAMGAILAYDLLVFALPPHFGEILDVLWLVARGTTCSERLKSLLP